MAFMSQEDAIAQAAAEAQAKRDAARRAVLGEGPAAPTRAVTVRVLPLGHEKVSMGKHVGGYGDAYYQKGERFDVGEDTAAALEARGFVEIEEEAVPELPQADASGKKA